MRDVLCGRAWELAPLLEEIETAVLNADEPVGTGRRATTHTWRAAVNVPAALAPHLDADYFAWTAVVEWSTRTFESRWRILPHALRDTLSCTDEVTLLEALGGAGTRICVEVDIQGLDHRKGLETVAYRIVETNWRKLLEAAVRHLQG
jgi:hypothetical protein